MVFIYINFNDWIRFFHSVQDTRDKAIFAILYSSGCSEKELVSLRVSDIDVKKKEICFGSAPSRISSLSSEMMGCIRHYLKDKAYFQERSPEKDSLLLKTRQGRGMSPKRIQQIVAGYSLSILGYRILPKAIRYTHIAHAVMKNVPVFSICSQTGLKAQRVMQIVSSLGLSQEDNHRYEL